MSSSSETTAWWIHADISLTYRCGSWAWSSIGRGIPTAIHIKNCEFRRTLFQRSFDIWMKSRKWKKEWQRPNLQMWVLHESMHWWNHEQEHFLWWKQPPPNSDFIWQCERVQSTNKKLNKTSKSKLRQKNGSILKWMKSKTKKRRNLWRVFVKTTLAFVSNPFVEFLVCNFQIIRS